MRPFPRKQNGFPGKCLRAPDLRADLGSLEIEPLALDTLASLSVVRSIQQSNGERSLSRYGHQQFQFLRSTCWR